jgi:hypothetical protein
VNLETHHIVDLLLWAPGDAQTSRGQGVSQLTAHPEIWWINNGAVEGSVTKIKLIKRRMFGRAGFALLRQRVLHAL